MEATVQMAMLNAVNSSVIFAKLTSIEEGAPIVHTSEGADLNVGCQYFYDREVDYFWFETGGVVTAWKMDLNQFLTTQNGWGMRIPIGQ